MSGWIAVDLDGTLAHYDGKHAIGEPIPKMVARVKLMLEYGHEVRIFTARVGQLQDMPAEDQEKVLQEIKDWCKEHIGQELPITATKDYGMIQQWDDRAIQVVPNTGETLKERILGVIDEVASDYPDDESAYVLKSVMVEFLKDLK